MTKFDNSGRSICLSGKMFPSRGDLHVAPFTDEALYMEQFNKVNFWYQEYFHGVNLSSLRNSAMTEYFRQPIVRPRTCVCLSPSSASLSRSTPSTSTSARPRLSGTSSTSRRRTRRTCTGLRFPWSSTCCSLGRCTAWLSGSMLPSSGPTPPCG